MLFTTFIFWLFFLLVLFLLFLNYNFFKSIIIQNLIYLSASYLFYAYWDWRFLGLIILVSMQTFFFGYLIFNRPKFRKFFLISSISLNLLILFFFKYFNFFILEFLNLFDLKYSFSFSIILPIGISFYIFQSLTYVIDIYQKKRSFEKNMLNYFAYVAFFPQLVAGPIERASTILPQLKSLNFLTSSNLYDGCRFAIIGLFLKIFIADNLAEHVDFIFANYLNLSGGLLWLGGLYFSIQIYCDFCGYSLIAIGIGRVMGINLTKNFDTPYFSKNIKEFWKKWHITLSSFFRDYIFIPLGGSRGNKLINYRNIIITFSASGLWHGANWTFIFWGIGHGILVIIHKFFRVKINLYLSWFVTVLSVFFLWIIFRSESMINASEYIYRMFSDFSIPKERISPLIFIIYYFIIDRILFRFHQTKIFFNKPYLEYFILGLIFVTCIGTINSNPNFIYFQF